MTTNWDLANLSYSRETERMKSKLRSDHLVRYEPYSNPDIPIHLLLCEYVVHLVEKEFHWNGCYIFPFLDNMKQYHTRSIHSDKRRCIISDSKSYIRVPTLRRVFLIISTIHREDKKALDLDVQLDARCNTRGSRQQPRLQLSSALSRLRGGLSYDQASSLACGVQQRQDDMGPARNKARVDDNRSKGRKRLLHT